MPKTSLNMNVQKTSPRRVRIISPAGAVLSDSTSHVAHLRREEVRTTVNTPNYRSYRRGLNGKSKDKLPMNPFEYTLATWNRMTGSYEQSHIASGERDLRTGNISNDIVVSNYWDFGEPTLNEKNRLLGEVINGSLRETKDQKVNLGVVFGERKRTADLILGTAENLKNAILDLRRGRPFQAISRLVGKDSKKADLLLKKLRRAPKDVGGQWLALQYGWQPLLSDVYGAAEFLAQKANEPVRTRISHSKTIRWYVNNVASIHGGTIPLYRRLRGRYTRKVVYYFSVSSQINKDLSALGIYNPLSVAWELLPYSFVADWFIPIGTFIDVLDATTGLTFQTGSSTEFTKATQDWRIDGTSVHAGWRYNLSGKGSSSVVRCKRVALGSFPLPHLPSFDTRIRPKRVANGLALIFQRIKR